jgi:hypothetical protein
MRVLVVVTVLATIELTHATLSALSTQVTDAAIHHYRDGDVVLYRRAHSRVWQCRYRLLAGKWLRVSTKQRNLKDAARRACELYDEARFRERLGLTAVARSVGEAARATLTELRAELASGTGKRIYVDYCSAIERLFLPFFGKRRFEQIDHRVVAQFEQWRNERIGRAPAHSTLLTYAAVWQRIQQTALDRGWLTAASPIPKLSVKGRKSQPRPAFSTAETQQLRESMAVWAGEQTRRSITGELRLMLRDYVELLLLTGMRHGTEAMRVGNPPEKPEV